MSFIYLASPYTEYRGGSDAAFRDAVSVSAKLTEAGLVVFSPVVHFHPISQRMPPRTHAFWMRQCQPYMVAARSMIIAQLPGWDKSAGVFEEREFFRNAGKQIRYLGWPLPSSIANDIAQLRWLVGLFPAPDYVA